MPSTHRPQTLKQAKKAYRKSGATVRLSDSELAIIERRAVLQERADRIKEREARRKANIKRKEERNQREREARSRMGIQEPARDHVGPSQLSLGGFLGADGKRKRYDKENEGYKGSRVTTGATRAEKEFWKAQEEEQCRNTPIQRTPWRNSLNVISANLTARNTPPGDSATISTLAAKDPGLSRMAPLSSSNICFPPRSPLSRIQPRMPPATAQRTGSKIPKTESDKHEDCQALVMGPPPSRTPLQVIPPKPFTQPKPLHQTKGGDRLTQGRVKIERCQATSMAPPPRRVASQCRPSDTKTQQKPPTTGPQHQSPRTVDECWDDFFVSGTQIARELSPPVVKLTPDAPAAACLPSALPPMVPKNESAYPNPRTIPHLPLPPRPPSQYRKAPPIIPEDDTAGLLDLISTQDLDFSGVLTQAAPHVVQDDTDNLLAHISTQDLDFSGELTQAAPQAPSTISSDFAEDLTEEDLEDVALEFERESTIAKSRTTTPHLQRTNPNPKRENEDVKREELAPKDLKPGSPAKITTTSSLAGGDQNEMHGFDFLEAYLADLDDPFEHTLDYQYQHAFEESDYDWGDLGNYDSDEDIIPDNSHNFKAEPEGKVGLDRKPCVSRTCSQEAKLAAEYDTFDLSTQDLRDLEYESLTWIP